MKNKERKQTIEIMVGDWYADHENEKEYSDFEIKGIKWDDDLQDYVAIAEDKCHQYVLGDSGCGDIVFISVTEL